MYSSFQFQWQDATGNNLFVSSYPNAFQAAITLAIAMQQNQSAKAIKITECKNEENGSISFTTRFTWGDWNE